MISCAKTFLLVTLIGVILLSLFVPCASLTEGMVNQSPYVHSTSTESSLKKDGCTSLKGFDGEFCNPSFVLDKDPIGGKVTGSMTNTPSGYTTSGGNISLTDAQNKLLTSRGLNAS